MNQTGQKTQEPHETDRLTAFPFIGEVLALALVNTEIFLRGKQHDFLTNPQDAAEWWGQATLHHPDRDRVMGEAETLQWETSLLAALKRLRAALRHVFLSLIERQPVDDSDLEELNQALALGVRVVERNEAGELSPVYQTSQPARGPVLLPLALSALRLITEGERDRLRKCANERCIVLFYDTTRSATRHWCSPQCMNRARSLRHYRQIRAKKTALSTHQTN